MMKKYIAALLFSLAGTYTISAQVNTAETGQKAAVTSESSAGEVKWAQDRTDKLASYITDLTAEQRSAITAANLRYAKRLGFIQNSKTIAPEALVQMRSDLFNYRMNEYKRTLTPEQALMLDTHLLDLKTDGEAPVEL